MHYLIDGYNVAHWLAKDPDAAPAVLRAVLMRALAARRPHDAESLRIFWDVRRPDPAIPANEYLDWCTVHNVPDADAAIVDAVHGADAPARVMVVSRDREVTGRSRQLGARSYRGWSKTGGAVVSAPTGDASSSTSKRPIAAAAGLMARTREWLRAETRSARRTHRTPRLVEARRAQPR